MRYRAIAVSGRGGEQVVQLAIYSGKVRIVRRLGGC